MLPSDESPLSLGSLPMPAPTLLLNDSDPDSDSDSDLDLDPDICLMTLLPSITKLKLLSFPTSSMVSLMLVSPPEGSIYLYLYIFIPPWNQTPPHFDWFPPAPPRGSP